jgi:hypothetical protein
MEDYTQLDIEDEIYVDDIPLDVADKLYCQDLKDSLKREALNGYVLRCEGYVGNRPKMHNSGHHEDDTWAIDVFNQDGLALMSFLYTSGFEYVEDKKLLSKFV